MSTKHWFVDREILKPLSIQSFIANLELKDQELVKRAITVYEDWKIYNERYVCPFCDKELTLEDVRALTPDDFNVTCSEHRHLSGVFQVDIERSKLGMPERSNYLKL